MKKLPKIDILKEHEAFKQYDHPDKDGILRFMMFCYSRESELLQEEENVAERRKKAANLSGLDMKKHEDIIELVDEDFRELLDYYLCHIERNNTFQMLVSCEIAFQEYQKQIRIPFQQKVTVWEKNKEGQEVEKEKVVMNQDEILKACETKGKLEELSEKTANRIQKYREEIYKNTGEETLKKTPMKRFSPENIVV